MDPILFLVLMAIAITVFFVFYLFDISWFSTRRRKWFGWIKHVLAPKTIVLFFRSRPRLQKVLWTSSRVLILIMLVAGGWWWYTSTHPSSPAIDTELKTPEPSLVGPPLASPEQKTVEARGFLSILLSILLSLGAIALLLLLDIGYKKQKNLDRKKMAEWWSWTLEKIQSLLEISAPSITWVVVVILFWRLEQRSPKAWEFLWTENHILTIATAIILLIFSALRFFARWKEDKKDGSKKAGVAQFSSNALILILIGLWAFYSIQYFQKGEKEFSLFAGDRVSPVVRDEKPTPHPIDKLTVTSGEWSEPVYIKRAYREQLGSDEGRFSVKTDRPDIAESLGEALITFSDGRTRTVVLQPRGKQTDYGDADKIQFRTYGTPFTVTVRVFR